MWKWIFTEQLLLEMCGIVITLQFLASNKLKNNKHTGNDELAKLVRIGCYFPFGKVRFGRVLLRSDSYTKKSYWGMSNAYYPIKLIDFCTKYNNDIWHSAILFNYPSGPGVIRPVTLIFDIQLCYLITLLDQELSDQFYWYMKFSYVI